ncbi:MAG: TetR/AcrR family transcriptional regulator [Pirellulales bacterium]
MNTAHSQEVCNLLIDSAEVVVTRDGVARLTLEAVAREAGLSKSGLLHHFPSKEVLIDAIVDRTVVQWSQSVEEAIEQLPAGPHRTARGLLHCCLGDASAWNEQLHRSSSALLAVLVHCPDKSTTLHQFYNKLHSKMEHEGRGSPFGDLVLAVIDGFWLRWVTGLAPLEDSQIVRMRKLLESLIPKVGNTKKKKVARRSS